MSLKLSRFTTFTSDFGFSPSQTLDVNRIHRESDAQAGLLTPSLTSATRWASPPEDGMTQSWAFFSGWRLLERKSSCLPSGDHLG